MDENNLSVKVLATFVITGIFVGFLMTAQFRSSVPTSSYLYDEIQAQQELIKSYTDDQAGLKSNILNLRKQIDEKQKNSSLVAEKNNLDILSQLKKAIGLETIKGGGVEIVLDDGVFSKRTAASTQDEGLIYAADLRDAVNLLFSAQVEGIAINDQRIIASTPISAVGNTILVNNLHVLPPFTITAIGDFDLVNQRWYDLKALADLQKRIKNHKIQFTMQAKKNVILPIYNGDFRLKYIKSALEKTQ